ncbi:hypothetical protein [Halapricum desulfuricans]|uniref:Uncharacterized protein n=1 Tax=Halapricum desulfuricans TaxID=2841257 RepID=A0A897NKH1_9EURY|nr:hypothetical protein [Halapricum desulfuricans]QSG14970.1 hypothetical protein HSEST_1441 [Halapricum desulfuricans]
MTIHAINTQEGDWSRTILYTDVDPPNWTSFSDWSDIENGPIPWRRADDQDNAHTAATWEHPDTGKFHIMINQYNTQLMYQDQLASRTGGNTLTTEVK